MINEGMWAGDVNDKYGRYASREPRVGTLDEVLGPEFHKRFGWGSCVLQYCSNEVTSDKWNLQSENPCRDSRTGPLCSHCSPGLSVTPFDLVSSLHLIVFIVSLHISLV